MMSLQHQPRVLGKITAIVVLAAIAWVFISPLVDLPSSTERHQHTAVAVGMPSILILLADYYPEISFSAANDAASRDVSLIDLNCNRLC